MKKISVKIAACLLPPLIYFLWFRSSEDTLIISMGIKTYRVLMVCSVIAMLVGIAAAILLSVFYIRSMQQETQLEDDGMTEEEKEELCDQLKRFNFGKWAGAKRIDAIWNQILAMEEHKNSLKFLLKQTKYLKEQPAVIIRRVEGCMFINIKKLINYMNAVPGSDLVLMQQKIDECVEHNAELLSKTKAFVIAVTDYVNKDMGEERNDEQAIDHVNSYMYVVLDAIEKEDIYLS